jgi:hypothetical protein
LIERNKMIQLILRFCYAWKKNTSYMVIDDSIA